MISGMPPLSAGLLPDRRHDGRPDVLLVPPGVPLNAERDAGIWFIPKDSSSPAKTILPPSSGSSRRNGAAAGRAVP